MKWLMDIASLDLIFLLLLEKYAINWVVIVKDISLVRNFVKINLPSK